MLDFEALFKWITRAFIAWCFPASRGRHGFDFTWLTDENIECSLSIY